MYKTVILNIDTGKIEPVKTKEELLLEIINQQQQFIILSREGRDNLETYYPDDWEHLKGEDDDAIYDSINDSINDLFWDLENNS